MVEYGEMDGIAEDILGETNCRAPVDALRLARLLQFVVKHGLPERIVLDEGMIYVDSRARPERVQGVVAHELGHYALARAGEEHDEASASYVGAAMLVPRRALLSDIRALGPLDLVGLRARHPSASYELIARRISEVRDAVVTVIDHGRVRRRLASPWLRPPQTRLDRIEQELANAALDVGGQVGRDDVCAVPVVDGCWRRVVLVRAP